MEHKQILKATLNESALIVIFQDEVIVNVPFTKLKSDSGNTIKEVLKILHVDQYFIILDTDQGEAGVPWDFVRFINDTE